MTQEEFEMEFVNKILCGDWIEVLKTLPSDTFHMCCTSPPYWAQRNYGCDGQMGLEESPELHIQKLVEGFREVRRVLRPDASLFLNYGDKYAGSPGSGGNPGDKQYTNVGSRRKPINCDLEQGNLLMLPARVALALQADGWILRSDIIWAKALSFCPTYSGSTMPESISGTRWERHRVKTGKLVTANFRSERSLDHQSEPNPSKEPTGNKIAEWADCPGCKVCEPNGGLVLRKGSGRCTKAHEHLFQFSKGPGYFWDQEAVREEAVTSGDRRFEREDNTQIHGRGGTESRKETGQPTSGRNPRDVWCINPQAYKGAHYATYPEKLVEPCIKVATSLKGVCPKCGSQWARILQRATNTEGRKAAGKNDEEYQRSRVTPRDSEAGDFHDLGTLESKTLGWRATCSCGLEETVPALVLDPFMGSGCTGMVAARLGRDYTGIEINPAYIYEQAKWRIIEGETGMDKREAQKGQKGLFV